MNLTQTQNSNCRCFDLKEKKMYLCRNNIASLCVFPYHFDPRSIQGFFLLPLCQWSCSVKCDFNVNTVIFLSFLPGSTVGPFLCYNKCPSKEDWHVTKRKGKKNSAIHTSKKNGHKNGALLLKTIDCIIEWNAPAPVYGSQASCWLFPARTARVVRLHNTAAGKFFFLLSFQRRLCARLTPPFKWISWNAQ